MVWPAASPDLNPIENYWSVFKRHLYAEGRQFSNKEELWQAILATFRKMERGLAKKLTESMDTRIIEVLKRDGKCINH